MFQNDNLENSNLKVRQQSKSLYIRTVESLSLSDKVFSLDMSSEESVRGETPSICFKSILKRKPQLTRKLRANTSVKLNLRQRPKYKKSPNFCKQGDLINHQDGSNSVNSDYSELEEICQKSEKSIQQISKILKVKCPNLDSSNGPQFFENKSYPPAGSLKLLMGSQSSDSYKFSDIVRSKSEKSSPNRNKLTNLLNQEQNNQYNKQSRSKKSLTIKNILQVFKNVNQMEIQEKQQWKTKNFQIPIFILTFLQILTNYIDKYQIVLNLIVLTLVFLILKKERINAKQKNDLEISQIFEIEANNELKENPPMYQQKIVKKVQLNDSNVDEKPVKVEAQFQKGKGFDQNQLFIQNLGRPRSISHQYVIKNKKQLFRELLLKNVTQGAMLCQINQKPIQRHPKQTQMDLKRLNSKKDLEYQLDISKNNSQILGQFSQINEKPEGLNESQIAKKNRKIELEVIEKSEQFDKVFQIHYQIAKISCDNQESFGNNSLQIDDLNFSQSMKRSLLGSYESQNLLGSLQVISNAGLNLKQQNMMELKIYMPYFISNETIIQYQSQSSASKLQKLSIMDILQEHFLQKKTKSRLFFMVDAGEDLGKEQQSQFQTDQSKVSVSKSYINSTLNYYGNSKPKEMEEIKEMKSNEEREKINSIVDNNSSNVDDKSLKSVNLESSNSNVDPSQSSKSKNVKKKVKRSHSLNIVIFKQDDNSLTKKRSNSVSPKNNDRKIIKSSSSSVSISADEQEESQQFNDSIHKSDHTSMTSQHYGNDKSGQQQHKRFLPNEEKMCYFEFEIKQVKDSLELQDIENLTFLSIKDVTTLVKNQKKICDNTYQDAIENNYSHEQMTPLNPILNQSPLVKQSIISLYIDKIHKKRNASFSNQQAIEGFQIKDLVGIIQNQREAKLNLQNIISIEQSAKSIWFYNTNQIQRMKIKKNQIKLKETPNTNLICTLWNVIWPFEHYVFKRRINIYLIKNLSQFHDMVADWNLYELVLFNILQNALKFNKNIEGDIVITMTCKEIKSSFQNSQLPKKYMFETQVIDSGIGIEPERQNLLFIPFQELNERIGITKSSNGSIGLGLSCSSDICKKVGGDITIKISEPGLTVIAFKYPVTLIDKTSNNNPLNECNYLGFGQKSGTIGVEKPKRNSSINQMQDFLAYQQKFTNILNVKQFEYIKLIGNNRTLSESVQNFLQSQKMYPNNGSKNNKRQSATFGNSLNMQPLFKELFTFPNQRIGFKLLESMEKQSGHPSFSLGGNLIAKSTLSNVISNISQPSIDNRSQRRSSIPSLVDQCPQLLLQYKITEAQRGPKSSNSRKGAISTNESHIVQLDISMEDPNQTHQQNQLLFPSQENIMNRSIQNTQQEEKKETTPKLQQMLMIIESEEEQIDSQESFAVEYNNQEEEKVDFHPNQILSMSQDEVEEIPVQSPRQHLKKLKIRLQTNLDQLEQIEEEPDGQLVRQQSFIQQISQINLINPSKAEKKYLSNQILNQASCQKLILKIQQNGLPIPKVIRYDIPDHVQDILINVNNDYIQQKGLQKYKRELNKQNIIYQLSDSSSNELNKSYESSRDESEEYEFIPILEDEERKMSRNLNSKNKLKYERLQAQSEENESEQGDISPMFQNKDLNFHNSYYVQPKSHFSNPDAADENQELYYVSISNSISQAEQSNHRQIVIGSKIISLDKNIITNLLHKNNDKQCNCEPRILIVEDTEFNMMTICGMVKLKFNIQPFEAQNGQVAIDMVRQALEKPCKCENRAFKMIFMDINMPVKDGYQATKEILPLMKSQGLQNEPIQEVDKYCNIVALTSYTGALVEQQCLESNMKVVYNKPLNMNQLVESVHKYFFQKPENFEEFYQQRLMREQIHQQVINS